MEYSLLILGYLFIHFLVAHFSEGWLKYLRMMITFVIGTATGLSVYFYDATNLLQFREIWLWVVIWTSSLWFITWGFDIVIQVIERNKFKDDF